MISRQPPFIDPWASRPIWGAPSQLPDDVSRGEGSTLRPPVHICNSYCPSLSQGTLPDNTTFDLCHVPYTFLNLLKFTLLSLFYIVQQIFLITISPPYPHRQPISNISYVHKLENEIKSQQIPPPVAPSPTPGMSMNLGMFGSSKGGKGSGKSGTYSSWSTPV